jgi:tetratricopeptide (TPR) repeat protein
LAAQVGEVREQAECLRYKAWSLGQIELIEEALATFDQAAALAKEAQDLNQLSEALRLKSALLLDNGQLPAALETIRAALAVSGQSVSPKERQWRLGKFFAIAARTPAPDVITRLAQVLTETTTDDRWFDIFLDDMMSAVTRAEVWVELRDLVQKYEAWLAQVRPFSIFDKIGTVWADFVTTRGRAATFALVARDLPVIAELMTKMPDGTHLRDLVAGIVSTCADAGFLRDVAGLIVEVFGPDAKDEATRLRAFAKFHAAEDKEKVLQRFDPDLAKAIRRMWNLPEPEDLLARRGRPKGR